MASSLAEAAQGQYPAEEVTELEERDEENAEQEDYTDDEGEGEGEEGIPIANLKAARPPAFRCHSISSNGAQPFKFRVSLTRSSRRAGRPRWAILPRLNSECIAPRTFVRIGSFVNIVSIVDGARQVDPALVLEMRELEGMTWLHIAWTYDIDEYVGAEALPDVDLTTKTHVLSSHTQVVALETVSSLCTGEMVVSDWVLTLSGRTGCCVTACRANRAGCDLSVALRQHNQLPRSQ